MGYAFFLLIKSCASRELLGRPRLRGQSNIGKVESEFRQKHKGSSRFFDFS